MTDEPTVTTEQWLEDCTTLYTAAMFGNPPGDWSDPERRQEFMDQVSEIEARMRAAS